MQIYLANLSYGDGANISSGIFFGASSCRFLPIDLLTEGYGYYFREESLRNGDGVGDSSEYANSYAYAGNTTSPEFSYG